MIPLNESTRLEFSLSIKNCSEKLERATLFIEGKRFDVSLPIIIENDKAIVQIPVLENVVQPGKVDMRMELVLGGVLYTPFKDKLEFFAPPTIQVESTEVIKASESNSPVIFIKSAETIVEKVEEETPGSKYNHEFARLIKEAFDAKKLKESESK